MKLWHHTFLVFVICDQCLVSAALLPGKEFSLCVEGEALWVPKPVWTLWRLNCEVVITNLINRTSRIRL